MDGWSPAGDVFFPEKSAPLPDVIMVGEGTSFLRLKRGKWSMVVLVERNHEWYGRF